MAEFRHTALHGFKLAGSFLEFFGAVPFVKNELKIIASEVLHFSIAMMEFTEMLDDKKGIYSSKLLDDAHGVLKSCRTGFTEIEKMIGEVQEWNTRRLVTKGWTAPAFKRKLQRLKKKFESHKIELLLMVEITELARCAGYSIPWRCEANKADLDQQACKQ